MFRKHLYISALLFFSLIINCTESETPSELTPPVLISPADGSTITSNPPTFLWHTVEGDSCDLVFRFEVATNSNFETNSIVISTMIPLTDTTYTPQDSFASGTYYWHMCTRQNA